MRTFTLNTKKGQITFQTALTDDQAVAALATVRGDFAASLRRQHQQRGLSHAQMAWAHKLAADAQQPAAPAAANSSEFAAIFAAFDAAKSKGAKRLKFRMQDCILSPSRDGENVWVNDPHTKVENRWGSESPAYIGKISRRGGMIGDFSVAVRSQIMAAANDPAAAAAAYGKETGSCSFCSRELTDQRSVDVGYGPICADKYSLPWG